MINKKILLALSICIALLSACQYDNFDEPDSTLKGSVVYDGQAVGVRTNGPRLELWQDGYALKKAIPVYIAQDGTFSARLFKGQYKLVRKADAPWLAQLSDTIIVDVKGTTNYDVEVTPYFSIKNEKYEKSGDNIKATFTIDKVVNSANLTAVNIYFGKGFLTDHNRNDVKIGVNLSEITDGKEVTITATIPEHLKNENYLYLRIGAQSNASSEYCYSPSHKISLK